MKQPGGEGKLLRGGQQTPVLGPECRTYCQTGRGQKMCIDISNADAKKRLPIDKPQDLLVAGYIGSRQAPQRIQHEVSPGQTSYRQFTDHKGMSLYCSPLQ
jgi:hypothetical protein